MKEDVMHWLLKGLLLTTLLLVAASAGSQPADTLFYEGFEVPEKELPAGWFNNFMMGEEAWQVGTGAGEFTTGQYGLPEGAAVGQQNAYFRVPAINAHVTRLISPAIDARQAAYPELSFWHAQYPRNGNHSTLKVYYAEVVTGPYTLLAEYPHAVSGWTHRTLQLPPGLSTLYVVFEGHSGGGTPGSVCVDEVLLAETREQAAYLDTVIGWQPTTALIPTGSVNNPVLKAELRVMGNTGSVSLEQFTAGSANDDDQDVAAGGVKLWFSAQDNFMEADSLGTAQDFADGMAVFQNLNHTLPLGTSYLWVSYDIDERATPGHDADAYLPAHGLQVNGATFPEKQQHPIGTREIRESLFADDFETDKGWTLSGEWQRATPLGLGGYQGDLSPTEGPADPGQATSGTMVLGTDLTGLGTYPGNYEANLPPQAWQAIMPAQDFSQHKDITLSLQRWLNVYFFARATIDISTDGGQSWETIWYNNLVNNTSSWTTASYQLPEAARQPEVLIRFTLGETGGTNLQSGWNIDDVVITGSFVSTDVGVSEWLTPAGGCGLTAHEEVSVLVTNYGTTPTLPLIPMAFSLDGGTTWQHDTLQTSLAPGESLPFTFTTRADLSIAGRYNQVLVKTLLEGDQDPTNDQLRTSIFSVPTLKPDLTEDFEADDGFWTAYGTNNSWRRATPSATIIDGAASGHLAWVTNPTGYNNPSEHSWVESPCLDFSDIENPVLDFWLNTNTYQGIDGMAVDYSLDGGATWKRLVARSTELAWNWYNHAGIYSLNNLTGNGQGWTGNSQGWINPRIVLPEETGHHPAVKLRMLFASNPMAIEYEGAAFDQVSVYAAPDDLALTAITAPGDACTHTATEALTVEITNMAINTIPKGSIIPVGLDDHTTGQSLHEEFALTQDLAPGQQVDYTFTKTFDLGPTGSYTFTAYTRLEEGQGFWGAESNDSLQATITTFGLPQITLGEDLFTTRADTLLLDPGPGFAGYLWQDGTSGQTYQVTDPGSALYHVTVTDHNGCEATDSIEVKTFELGVAELLSPTGGCQPAGGSLIKARLRNNGHEVFPEGLQVPLRVALDGQWTDTLTYVLPSAMAPATTLVVEFTTALDLPDTRDYEVVVEHHMEDADPDNNQLVTLVESNGYPQVDLGDPVYTTNPREVVLDPGPGFASYLWQDGSTLQSYQVSSAHTSTYWVRVTDSNGCSNADTVQVITHDAGITAITSPQDACLLSASQQTGIRLSNHGVDAFAEGTTFELQLQVNNNILAKEKMTLQEQWLPGTTLEYTFATTADMQAAGTYDLGVALLSKDAEEGNNVFSSTVTASGYPDPGLPSLIVTNQPDTLVLDAGAGFASYLWNTGSTSQTQQVTWESYWVVVTNEAGCETRADISVEAEFIDLAIHQLISPANTCQDAFGKVPVTASLINAGNVPIAAGEQISLKYRIEGKSSADESFTLKDDLLPGNKVAFTFTGTLDFIPEEAFTIRTWLEHPDDGLSDNDHLEQQVNIWPLPAPSLGDDIYTNLPDTVVLHAGDFAGYLWQDGITTTPSFNVTQQGLHWVEVTDDNGCKGRDSLMVELLTGARAPEQHDSRILVYPNPAGRQVTLRMNTRPQQQIIVELWDQQGNRVMRRKVVSPGLLEEKVDLDDLPGGMYYIRILENHKATVRKLVVTGTNQ